MSLERSRDSLLAVLASVSDLAEATQCRSLISQSVTHTIVCSRLPHFGIYIPPHGSYAGIDDSTERILPLELDSSPLLCKQEHLQCECQRQCHTARVAYRRLLTSAIGTRWSHLWTSCFVYYNAGSLADIRGGSCLQRQEMQPGLRLPMYK